MLQGSIAISSHVLSTCFHAFESHTERTMPSPLLFVSCHVINYTNDKHLYIHFKHGIIGKCQKNLQGTRFDPLINWDLLHFGQVDTSLNSHLNIVASMNGVVPQAQPLDYLRSIIQ
jgi:hypothetical protein